MEDVRTQWHPAFCSAMKLDLIGNGFAFNFIDEYLLNSSPLRVDLLIIRKHPGTKTKIENEIGKLFKGHNIVEYKSPQDSLNIDTLFKTIAYACLYKIDGDMVDSIKADDVTISLIRDRKPVELFRQIKKRNMGLEKAYDGIYYTKYGDFDIQIIVGNELGDSHIWLTSLTENLSKGNAEKLLRKVSMLKEKGQRDLADSVLQVTVNKNRSVFNDVKEDLPMCEALKELMKPELEAMEAEMKAKMEAEMKAKMEAEMKAEMEAEMKAEMEAEMKAMKARIAKLEAENKSLKESKN